MRFAGVNLKNYKFLPFHLLMVFQHETLRKKFQKLIAADWKVKIILFDVKLLCKITGWLKYKVCLNSLRCKNFYFTEKKKAAYQYDIRLKNILPQSN